MSDDYECFFKKDNSFYYSPEKDFLPNDETKILYIKLGFLQNEQKIGTDVLFVLDNSYLGYEYKRKVLPVIVSKIRGELTASDTNNSFKFLNFCSQSKWIPMGKVDGKEVEKMLEPPNLDILETSVNIVELLKNALAECKKRQNITSKRILKVIFFLSGWDLTSRKMNDLTQQIRSIQTQVEQEHTLVDFFVISAIPYYNPDILELLNTFSGTNKFNKISNGKDHLFATFLTQLKISMTYNISFQFHKDVHIVHLMKRIKDKVVEIDVRPNVSFLLEQPSFDITVHFRPSEREFYLIPQMDITLPYGTTTIENIGFVQGGERKRINYDYYRVKAVESLAESNELLKIQEDHLINEVLKPMEQYTTTPDILEGMKEKWQEISKFLDMTVQNLNKGVKLKKMEMWDL